MEYGAIDLHKKESQVRIVTDCGEVLDRRIATTRDRFTAVFAGRRPMRILLEASTESERVAQHLETRGHEVIVADPTFAPMYSERSRRVKTDRRDVAALADACHQGCYRAAHRRSASQRTVQAHLNVRRELTVARVVFVECDASKELLSLAACAARILVWQSLASPTCGNCSNGPLVRRRSVTRTPVAR